MFGSGVMLSRQVTCFSPCKSRIILDSILSFYFPIPSSTLRVGFDCLYFFYFFNYFFIYFFFLQRSVTHSRGTVSSTPPTFAAHGSSTWPQRSVEQQLVSAPIITAAVLSKG